MKSISPDDMDSGGMRSIFNVLDNVKITRKLTGLLIGLLIGFVIIGLAYMQVLKTESEAIEISEKMLKFEAGIHEVQLDLLNARHSEVEFYLKKYPIFLGKVDTRIIVASQNLKNLIKLVEAEKELSIVTELGAAFEKYRENFIQAAETQVELGLDENTGLNIELNAEFSQIEKIIKISNSPALERSLLKIRQLENDFVSTENIKFSKSLIVELNVLQTLSNKSLISLQNKNKIKNALILYKSSFSRLIEAVVKLSKQKRAVRSSAKSIDPLFDKLISISSKIVETSRKEATNKRNTITVFFLATLIIIALAASIAMFLLAQSIIKPMKVLQNTVIKVNEGDLNARAGLNRSDELGELSNAFDKLLDERLTALAESEKESEKLNDSVIDLIKAVSKVARNKDLTVKIPVSEDITGAISDSLNLLAQETSKIMYQAQTTSSHVADVSSTIKEQSDNVIIFSNEEREEVDNTTKMLEESVITMNEISTDANDANEKAEITIQNTQKALETVLSSVEGINSIRSTISETEKRIKRLGERSQEITGIVSLINSIAERTHILALNASMHAASAGEAGRGFAVVADEVQRLAENAREATSEISTVVNNIRIETADTVAIINTVITQVAEGTELVNEASESMKITKQATNDLVNSVGHIAKSSVKQANVSKQILDRAHIIKESTEKTGKELLEQTKSTEELVRYANELVNIVGVFMIADNGLTKSPNEFDVLKTQDIKHAV